MPHLKFHGKVLKQYHGIDQDTVVVAGPGDVIHVSDHKAERLLKDFPTEFEVHHGAGAKAKEVPEESADPELELPAKKAEIEPKDFKPLNKMIGKAKKRKSKWQ